MYFLLNHLPDLVITLIGAALQWLGAVLIIRNIGMERRKHFLRPMFFLAFFLSCLLLFALALQAYRVAQFFPPRFITWTKAIAIVWLIGSAVAITVRLILMWLPAGRHFSPGRRRVLL